MQSGSVARGLAGIAIITVAVVIMRGAALLLGGEPATPQEACAVPVEVVSARGVRLSCATDASLRACDVRRGDRVAAECRVVRGGMAAATRLLAGVPIDVNAASVRDLELLDGIGPKLAEAIVAERDAAAFVSVDDLVRVRGIGPARLKAMRPFVTAGTP